MNVTEEEFTQTSNIEYSHITESSVGQFLLSEDEYDYFSKYVANKLRKYDKRTSAIVQHKISNILFKADMEQFW